MLKTRILSVSGAALVAGALASPMGVFAAQTEFTDTVQITINSSCGLTQAENNDLTDTIKPKEMSRSNVSVGTTLVWDNSGDSVTPTDGYVGPSTNVSVVCNDTGGWSVFAKGASVASGDDEGNYVNTMVGTNGKFINTGADFDNTNSLWAFKVSAVGDNTEVQGSYGDFAAIPKQYTKVLSSKEIGSTTDYASGAFSTGYKVYVGTTQEAGTYTGKVAYVLVHPANTSPQTPAES